MKKIKHFFEVDENFKYIKGTEKEKDGGLFVVEKYDGTAVLIKDGQMFARFDAKSNVPPEGFIEIDGIRETTNKKGKKIYHNHGWLPVNEENSNKYGYKNYLPFLKKLDDYSNGTYELIGKNFQGNLYKLDENKLMRHENGDCYQNVVTSYNELLRNLERLNATRYFEGFVLYFENGEVYKVRYDCFKDEDVNNAIL